MHFLPDVYVPCEVCKGARYNRDTLDIDVQGQEHRRRARHALRGGASSSSPTSRPSAGTCRRSSTSASATCASGQPAPTLSGGEAQRVKLATELAKRSTGHTIYILDEPTTGLHFEDIRKLLIVLSRLVDQGNTVLVIEHNLDVIKTADWLIDLGPEGGSRRRPRGRRGHARAGRRRHPASHTGQFLAPLLGVTPGAL